MKRKSLLGVILILFVAAIASGGIYAARALKRPPLDEITLCKAGKPPAAATVVVIDKTDPFNADEQARIRDVVLSERDTLSDGARIAVILLGASGETNAATAGTLVDLCNPGSAADILVENRHRVKARYRDSFEAPIELALQNLADGKPAATSPIAATVRAALENAAATEPPPALKLVLVSDLMESTSAASAYNGTLTETDLRKLLAPKGAARLPAAEVVLALIARPASRTRQDAAVGVWRRVLRDLTGREPRLLKLG